MSDLWPPEPGSTLSLRAQRIVDAANNDPIVECLHVPGAAYPCDNAGEHACDGACAPDSHERRRLAVINAEPILDEAARLTTRDRQATYGHPLDDFTKGAAMWSAILGVDVTPEQYALCMIAVKIARLVETPDHRDSIVDVAGYANCYSMLAPERARREG